MDIILVNPYYSQKKEYHSFHKPALPLGLMYLASYLRKLGIGSKIIEFGIFDSDEAIFSGDRVRLGISDQNINSLLAKERPKIVGITSMYSIYYRDVMQIAQIVKKFDSKIKIVIGGNHPSSYYNFVLKDKNIDFVVIGEGEQTFMELCKAILSGGNNFEDIEGLAFNDGSKIVQTKEREKIENLDDIPFPAKDLVNFKKYAITENDSPYLMRYPASTIITSRGCPNKCIYCTIRAVWGRSWRGRSPKNVVDEIEDLIKNYGIKEFAFLDDSASINKKRWQEICEEIIKRKLNIKWTTPNGIAHWTLDKKAVKKMYEAGCYRITFGIESGNVETRRFLGKPYSLSQAKKLIQYANKIGMWTICTNIIGFPYEKINSIRDTLKFAKSCGTDFATFYLLMPQPTSDVYAIFRKENLLNLDSFFENISKDPAEFENINYALTETGTDTLYFKKEDLRQLQKKAYRSFIIYRALSFIFCPWKIFQKIKSKEDLYYCIKLAKNGLNIFWRLLNPRTVGSGSYLYRQK